MELIPGVINAAAVKQFCPSCGYVETVARMELNMQDRNPEAPKPYVAWCPCGAVFNQDVVLTTRNNN